MMHTTRQQNEKEFYDHYYSVKHGTAEFPPPEIAFDLLSPSERKQHNIYWEFARHVRESGIKDRTVLEMGCGAGEMTALYARCGARVFGFDISAAAISIAKRRLQHYGLGQQAQLSLMAAEHLEFPDRTFDHVFGVGILHHIDIASTAAEIRRVLKPGGSAAFLEWVEWPLFEELRNLPLLVHLFPHGGYGKNRNITADERKLGSGDEACLRAHFRQVEYERFYFLTRLAPFMPRWDARLQRADRVLFQVAPALKRWAAAAIIKIQN